jgi:hypothetical protein
MSGKKFKSKKLPRHSYKDVIKIGSGEVRCGSLAGSIC